MMLTVNHLEKIYEETKLSTVSKEILGILLSAINDWPHQIGNLIDYENEIYELIGEETNKKKLQDYLLNIDYSKNAWEAESLSQLIEFYNYYEDHKPLKEIFKELKIEIEENF